MKCTKILSSLFTDKWELQHHLWTIKPCWFCRNLVLSLDNINELAVLLLLQHLLWELLERKSWNKHKSNARFGIVKLPCGTILMHSFTWICLTVTVIDIECTAPAPYFDGAKGEGGIRAVKLFIQNSPNLNHESRTQKQIVLNYSWNQIAEKNRTSANV